MSAIKRGTRRPAVKDLQEDPRYILVRELEFREMVPFVLEQIRRRSLVSIAFATINLGLLIWITGYIIQALLQNELSVGRVILLSVYGIFAGSLGVVPVHEFIHGIAYKLLGAKKIHFGADLDQMIFFVTSDRYPVSGSELIFLALSPFLTINLVTILMVTFLSPQAFLFPAIFLFIHNLMCIGDFALVNYVHLNPQRIYTYDEVGNRISFFYEEIREK